MMKHEKIIESIDSLNSTMDRLEDVVEGLFCRPLPDRVTGEAKKASLDDFLTDTPDRILQIQNRIIGVIEDLHALTIAPEENKKA